MRQGESRQALDNEAPRTGAARLKLRGLTHTITTPRTSRETQHNIGGRHTAAALGDPIEVSAQRAVLRQARREADPLVMSAVKDSVGHLEAAANGQQHLESTVQ